MSFAPNLAEVSVETLAQRMAAAPDTLQLLDVREPQEVAIASVPGFMNVPLSQSAQWSATLPTQLDPHGETYVICHHGMRSAQMCHWLMQQGFTQVQNVAGGIDAYAVVVDPTIPRY
ncbi:MAG: rhodanese-like domain-containing protein [Thermosynechococcaceae cyanobacterium]